MERRHLSYFGCKAAHTLHFGQSSSTLLLLSSGSRSFVVGLYLNHISRPSRFKFNQIGGLESLWRRSFPQQAPTPRRRRRSSTALNTSSKYIFTRRPHGFSTLVDDDANPSFQEPTHLFSRLIWKNTSLSLDTKSIASFEYFDFNFKWLIENLVLTFVE